MSALEQAPPSSATLVCGLTLCARCRTRDAVLTLDPDERWAQHLCFDCLEDFLERDEAAGINRVAVTLLQRAQEEPARPLPVKLEDWRTTDQSKLNELRAQWRAYERTLAGAPRCWALRPDGSRCVRDESERGLCETHLNNGCTMPGLGWSVEGKPIGRIVARRGREKG